MGAYSGPTWALTIIGYASEPTAFSPESRVTLRRENRPISQNGIIKERRTNEILGSRKRPG